MSSPLVLALTVGLTSRLLPHAPRIQKRREAGWLCNLKEIQPAVTSTAQATFLTGKTPQQHGIVANGWLFRETMEVRFWQQSNNLLQQEPLYVTARRETEKQGRPFKVAKLFWWYNQGAKVDIAVTPKPHYGADGNKAFDVSGKPEGLAEALKKQHGPFPFPAFWGPMSGLASTQWISNVAATVLKEHRPDLMLVYLPHLDYLPQSLGPSAADMPKRVKELDDAIAPLDDAATQTGARLWFLSEYGHCDVTTPIYSNRLLRQKGLLTVRPGPFGEQLETFESRAIAVVDHQHAHVYVKDASEIERVAALFQEQPGIAAVLVGEARETIQLNHPRSGEIVLVAKPRHWFAYPFWQEDQLAPDYARCVDIHRKPGFDPCELLFDPKLKLPKLKAARKVLQKKLGFRMLMDVIPLDASLIRGSHGLPAEDPLDRPVLIGTGARPGESLLMTSVKDVVLGELAYR